MASIKITRRKEKRGECKEILLPALLFFLLFPYIISGFSNVEKQTLAKEETPGQIQVLEKKVWGSKEIPLEEYLVGMVAATIPVEYETETLKAQAVLLRSYCVNHMKKEEGKKVINDEVLKNYFFSQQDCEELWGENTAANLAKIEKAVSETKGMILVCNGDIVEPPFCRMSNGKTRDISEYVIKQEDFEYMKSIVCEKDSFAPNFVQYIEISREEFERVLKELARQPLEKIEKITLYRDNNGYIQEVQTGGIVIDSEKIREALGLASSCFSLETIGKKIEIQTKGMGHGFGFSQYEANQMALDGKNYMYLINYFFQNITLERL